MDLGGYMEVIAISGSLNFKNEMMMIAVDLELKGKCVLSSTYPVSDDKDSYNEEEIKRLKNAHYKKIDMADSMYVVNVGGYIGESTREEIEYAKSKGKNIYYLENIDKKI